MKRSGPLKRNTPLQSKSQLKRTPMKKKAKRKPANSAPGERWRCRGYLNWIKKQPCVMTGMPADDPHHLIGQGNLSGMGLTAPDWAVMPVTREAHNIIHDRPESQHMQWEWVARSLGKAIEEGVLVFNAEAAKQ